ncbi:branched-chain-amino-acid transaminase [Pontiella sulfatireligans]|uniref:Branched-chain-amino-acid aminotransferase n=1 Tax=Pontiella sulfatireligans TaxID=2750658 RepID=A0A6C2UEW3_9BACT|nr:branched-chain-amino-acid transaminase [Pontiella sulfatireligans]VGO18459.1 Branched-chain-amino-acid aminotransferase [Pontiella sulfatireligans]
MKIFLGDKLVDEKDAVVSVFDHGLLYGDGVFEGIRAYNNRIFLLDEHIDRLYDSAKAIALKIPMSKEEMSNAVIETCKANEIADGYIRLVVTRGKGTLGLNPYLCNKAQIIIIAAKIQLYPQELYENGLKIVTVGTIRNHPEAINPRIKSLNYLNNIMAKIEAINAGCMECLMLNHKGEVAEASGDNIFAIKNGVITTPPSNCGSLEGLTRNKVMEIARAAGYEVREAIMARYDLYVANEVFLTGTAAEIISVVDIDKREIGDGKPGKVTTELAGLYAKCAHSEGTLIV